MVSYQIDVEQRRAPLISVLSHVAQSAFVRALFPACWNDGMNDDWNRHYKRLFASSFAIGLLSGVVGWTQAKAPLALASSKPADLALMTLSFGFLGMLSGAFVGLCVKAFLFDKASSSRGWLVVYLAAFCAAAIVTIPFAVASISRLEFPPLQPGR
jgi:hypothetical protein